MNALGDKTGRIHLGKQDLAELQTRKMKGLKRRRGDGDDDGDDAVDARSLATDHATNGADEELSDDGNDSDEDAEDAFDGEDSDESGGVEFIDEQEDGDDEENGDGHMDVDLDTDHQHNGVAKSSAGARGTPKKKVRLSGR